MRVAGIDPGYRCIGLAHMEIGAEHKPMNVHVAEVKPPEDGSDYARARVAVGAVIGQLEDWGLGRQPPFGIEAVGIEQQFIGTPEPGKPGPDPRDIMRLALLTGWLSGAIGQYHRPVKVVDVTPDRAKQATGAGPRASKEQVAELLARLYGLNIKSESDHVTDAIAIAMAVRGILHVRDINGQV